MKKAKKVLICVFALCTLLFALTFTACDGHRHEYNYTVTKEATCENDGSRLGVCNCGKTIVETIPKIDHTVVYSGKKEATCVEDGNTEIAYCSRCNSKLGGGEVIRKLGHSYGEWEETIASTSTVKGERRRECERCGRYEYASLPLVGHNYKKGETVAPCCASKGYTVYQCVDCQDYYFDDFIPALEHTYTYYRSLATSCDVETYDSAKCEVCGFVAYVEIHPATGHNFAEWEVSIPSTCTQDGEEVRECQRCGEKEARTLISTGHDYIGTVDNEKTFVCTICNEITVNEKDIGLIREVYLQKQPNTFEFYVFINEEGDFTEEYVKNNLTVYNTMFVGTEAYEEYGLQDYLVEKISENRFRIYVDLQNLYEAGYTYSATVQGALSLEKYNVEELRFEAYNTKKLTFTIADTQKADASYSGELIFLSALENQNPGYNPSEIEFDEESGLMYITVWKTDGIEVGDILFIGEATCAEEIAEMETEGHFGKVEEIAPNTKEEFVIILGAPEQSEIFDNLDVYFEGAIDFTNSKEFNDQVAVEAVNALLRSEDFNKFIAGSEKASETFFAPMGVRPTPLSDTDVQSSLKFNPDFNIDGKTITVSIDGSLERKLEFEDDLLKSAGKFFINFKAVIEFEFDISLNYKIKWFWFIPRGLEQFNFCLTQTDNFSFAFNIGFDMACSNLMSDFVYYDGEQQKTIHIATCLHLKKIKDESKIKKLTLAELEDCFEDKNYHCCKTCNPKNLHNLSTFVLSKSMKVIHTTSCPMKGNIAEENLEYSNESLDNLISDGYECCGQCHPESNANFRFAEYLTQSLASADIGETLEKVKKWTNAGENKDLDDTIYLCKVEVPIFEIISVTVEVSLVIDFKLEITLTYEYQVSHENLFSMYYESGKMKSNYSTSEKVLKNEITLAGSMETKVGINAKIGVGIANLSRWINIGMYVEVGVYNEIDGILHKNFVTDESYTAAYFESGLYLEIGAYYRFIFISDEIKIAECEIPFIRLGYDSIYYNYENSEFSIVLTENTYELDLNEILLVRYYNLKEQTSGTVLLTETQANGVKISFECNNGNVSWSGGEYSKQAKKYLPLIITVKDSAPCEVSDVFRIVVTGNKNWINYKAGGVSVQLKNFEIELSGIVHSWALEYSKDENYHWIDCSDCDEKKNFGSHSYVDENCICQEPILCNHVWAAATCTEAKTCSLCGETEGEALGHDYKDGVCQRCDAIEPTPYEYFTFTLLQDDTYSIAAKDVNNMPTEVVLPSTYEGKAVTVIANNAFRDCESLTSIKIPNSVTLIGSDAFINCSHLISVDIPNSITYIGYYAFASCTSLTSVEIPDSVTFIGDRGFVSCTSLNEIIVAENNDFYCSIDGNLYTEDKTVLKVYPSAKKGAFVIPEFVNTINEAAFAICRDLTSIVIPNSVTSIGTYAFAYCTSLTSIEIPNSVTSIGEMVFYNCSNLTSVVIGNSVTSIGSSTFSGCSSLTSVEIPDSVTSIGSSTFSGCSSLTIYCEAESTPSGWDEDWNSDNRPVIWGYKEDEEHTSYEYFTFTLLENDTYSITAKDVENMPAEVILPSIYEGKSVSSVGEGAFWTCDSLTSVEIPDSVTSIGDSAFSYCYFLTSIVIPNSVTSIGEGAFSECYRLSEVVNKSSHITVERGSEANGCVGLYAEFVYNGNDNFTGSNLTTDGNGFTTYQKNGEVVLVSYVGKETEITIPSNVTQIRNYALAICSGLTSVVIPDSITAIGDYAFALCDSLTSVAIPNSITSIGECAFAYCGSLTTVIIPDSVTSIGDKAFAYCSGLTSIEIPNSVTSIGESAFAYCDSLTSVIIPSRVTSIGQYVFWKCDRLTIYCEAERQPSGWDVRWNSGSNIPVIWDYKGQKEEYFIFTLLKDGTYSIAAKNVNNMPAEVILPSVYEGQLVTSIADYAFEGCIGLTSIEIPDSVTSIGRFAFTYCYSLTSVVIGNSVTFIGPMAFRDSDKLVEVINKSSHITVTVDGSAANGELGSCAEFIYNSNDNFTGSNLTTDENGFITYQKDGEVVLVCYVGEETDITIPSNVTQIRDYAFEWCIGLTSIEISDSVTSIGDGAFYGCRSLTSIEIPDSVTSIGDGAFDDCSSLTSIEIPNSVTSIGGAFSNCSSLTSIKIPNSVTSIGSYAFNNCSSLTSIKIPNSVTLIGYGAFEDCSSLTIYCEAESKPSGWDSAWNSSGRPVYWYRETKPTTSGNYWYYDENGNVTVW